jgi:hypothetical protein
MKNTAKNIVDHIIFQGDAEAPRPLMRELPPAEPFPVDALGELASAVHAVHDRVQAPLAICAQSVLGTATLVVQGYANIELPIGGKRVKPISNYLITIAESGERKTEADFQASWAIRKYEESLREKYDAAVLSYSNDKTAWEKEREALVKEAKKNRRPSKLRSTSSAPRPCHRSNPCSLRRSPR